MDGEPLSDLEFKNFFTLMVAAGNDTTRYSMVGGLVALLEHPDELARLQEHPELIPSAVEEMLRWTSVTMHFRRTATADVELHGQRIRAGDFDERRFPDPYRFDIARDPNDHLGLARGRYLPRRYAERGAYHCMSLFALGYDRGMTPSPASMMLEGLPDLHATFDMDDLRLGWEPNTAVAVADIWFRDEPVDVSARHALKRAIAAWEELGYTPKIGIELEAFVLQRSDDGQSWVPWETPGGYVYGTGTAVDPVGLLDEIMREAEDANLPIESINSEYDIPQFELTLHDDDAPKALDDALLFKVLAREIAHRHGLLMTFLGKPMGDRGGSGLHVNISLSDADGNNLLNDADADDGLSSLARQMIAGMLAHHEGMTALLAPTVNAYKRLGPGTLTGYWANWGYDHRG